jgi:imidazolonepropionase-like amidohydrolase
MRIYFLLVFFLAASYLNAQLLIRNTTVVDVINKKLVTAQDVLIDNGVIRDIGKKLSATSSTQVIDGTGRYLVPGFVDAHVHFFQSGGIYTRPDAIDLRSVKAHTEEIKWAHENMESFLRRYASVGITTVIDVGATVNFLKQRDTFQTKSYAPNIYMSGPLLTTWEPPVYKNLNNDEPFNEMKTEADARAFVQQQLANKPDFIKIWYIVLGDNVDSAARKHLPFVQAVIDEAHKNKLRVAVHATERITAQLAVEAGADYLVHSVDDELVNDAFVELLKKKKTVLSPTLLVSGNYGKVFGQTYQITPEDFKYAHATPLNSVIDLKALADSTLAKQYKQWAHSDRARSSRRKQDSIMRANLKKLHNGGVTIATGTDAGNIGTQHVSSYFDELKAMQQSGMNLWHLLQASTVNGAKAIGKEEEFGSIRKGQMANLVLLNKNPVESLDHWQSIDWVINKGVAIKPDSINKFSPTELVEQQLLGYNAHNLDAFLAPYADDVEVYDFPNKLTIKGKENMRKAYEFMNRTPKLYCRLLNRITQGNIVIDHEEVWGFDDKPFYGVAIYEIKNGKISKVYFPQDE